MCQPAAPIEMKPRLMLCQSLSRVPLPASGSSSQRMSCPPQLNSSTLGASARFTRVSETCGVGAPTVVSFAVPTAPRFRSESNGAHSRRCSGSVSAFQTLAGGWCRSRTRTSVHFSPSFRTSAPVAAPGSYLSRLLIFSSFRWWHLIHSVEVAFESVKVGGPIAAEGSQPGVHLHERLRPEAVDAPLRVDARLDEAGLTKHTEVFGHRGLRHLELAFDFAHRLLGRGQQTQNGPAIRFRDDGESRFHRKYIPISVYTCQAINGQKESTRSRLAFKCVRHVMRRWISCAQQRREMAACLEWPTVFSALRG